MTVHGLPGLDLIAGFLSLDPKSRTGPATGIVG